MRDDARGPRRDRFLRATLAALALAAASAAVAPPALADMVNCEQLAHDDSIHSPDYIRFDPAEECFGDRKAAFVGYALLVTNNAETRCEATLKGGVFVGGRWFWSEPADYRFGPYETREVYFDLKGRAQVAVGDIELLYAAQGAPGQCGGRLEIRHSTLDPLPRPGTYFNSPEKDAYFKIMSEDFEGRGGSVATARGVPIGMTVVRQPVEGPFRSRPVVAYEFYTDLKRTAYPLDPGEKDDEKDDERSYSQFHLERWNDIVYVWETVVISRPHDISEAKAVQCADSVIDCYGDLGILKRVLPDGHYRIRARHYWGRWGWREWSSWRPFSINFVSPKLPDPDTVPTWKTRVLLWVQNNLLGPFEII